MSVLIVTSVIDLHTDLCPRTTANFLNLCRTKFYNGCLFHNVQKDFLAQTGDPTGTGDGGGAAYRLLYGDHHQSQFFDDEIRPELTHAKKGTVAMASAGNASQFYVTLRPGIEYLDGQHTVFGTVTEGFDTLEKINESYVDGDGRPFKNIRIKHTYVLYVPDELKELVPDDELVPANSPRGKPKDEILDQSRLEDTWIPLDETVDPVELKEMIRAKEARSNAVILEFIGDIPNRDGCIKFDATGYRTQDRHQGAEKKSKDRDYVLRDKKYDLVFDDGDGTTADKQDRRDTGRRKMKLVDWRSEAPRRSDRDRKGRHDDHNSYNRPGNQRYSRHDRLDYSKRQRRSRDQEMISMTGITKDGDCGKGGRHKKVADTERHRRGDGGNPETQMCGAGSLQYVIPDHGSRRFWFEDSH